MQYQKIVSGKYLIELHNSWSGEESVYVNGQLVSRESSFWGTNHYFMMLEGDQKIRFILTTKVGANMQVQFDLSRNGELVAEDVPIPYGAMPQKPHLALKKAGLKHLRGFDLEAALTNLTEAVEITPDDPELYFHMACAHSVLEQPLEGLRCLKKSIEMGFQDQALIITHDMLAYLRIHPAFEDFKASGFTEIEPAFFKKAKNIEMDLV